jgi:hypothetical protein
MPRRYGWRLRSLATSLPVETAKYYAVMAALSVGLGYLSSLGATALFLAVAVSVLLFIGLGFLAFAWLLFEDDWWNDTMWEQTTAGVLALVLHLGLLPTAWFWGRGFGG